MTTVSAVVLAWGPEPHLRSCIDRLLASERVELTVVVVDNGCESTALADIAGTPRLRLLEPGRNLGYAAGCNAGAGAADADVLVFVNSDCLVDASTIALLADEVSGPGAGLATASVRLAESPHLLNSAGNPVHFTGLSWAGHLGHRAEDFQTPVEVASVSGACFAVRRTVWEELGGFPAQYFAYHEDVELSLRCWLSGRPVRYVPEALCYHHYEFSRHAAKAYLLERNRLLTLLTVYSRKTLLLLSPALLVNEVAVTCLALAQGWFRQKARGWLWIIRHLGWVRQRRRSNLRTRQRPDSQLRTVLTGKLDPAASPAPKAAIAATAPLEWYWWAVRRWI